MRRSLFTLVTCVLLALVVGACGSDDDEDAQGSQDQSNQAAQQPSGEPIKVMVITPYENPLLDWGMAIRGAEAAAEAINADGGIGDRPIEVVPCNERVDPNRAARCARDARQQGVTSTIVNSLFPAQIFPLLDAAKIPNVGGFVTEAEDTQAEMAYPIFPGANLINGAWPGVLSQQGKASMAAVVEGRASTVTDVEVMEDGARENNIEFNGAVGVPVETTDFSPKVQEISDLDADANVVLLSRPLLTGLISAAGDLGFESPFATQAWTVFPSMLDELGPATEGLLTLDQVPPATAGDEIPAIAQFNEEMDAAGFEDQDDRHIIGIQAWLALHAIGMVADRVEGKVDNTSFVAEMDTGEPVDLFGLLEWVPAGEGPAGYDRLSNGDLYQSEVRDGELVLLEPEPVDGFALAGLE